MNTEQPSMLEGYRLLHAGTKVLARMEENGIRVDIERLDRSLTEISKQIAEKEASLREDNVFRAWRRTHGTKTNLGSRQQLGKVLFETMGLRCLETTATGQPKVSEETLEEIDLPFVKDFLEIEKLKKVKSTYLEGIKREVVDGFLHPMFDLNTARSFRSSSQHPNIQNMPIRDQEAGGIVRKLFIPREGCVLVEIDFKALEVCISACYHKDPVMIAYLNDPTKDMHRDMAAQCFKLKIEEVSKDARFYAKNQFVFPQFYGDYYVHCAANLWKAIRRGNLRVNRTDVPLKEHLAERGIEELGECDPEQEPIEGTFEHHIRTVERDFWGRRFKVYAQWKKNWWEEYKRKGWFSIKTGFRVAGVYGRNDVVNYPNQGSAFHCLLWCLIEIQKWIDKNKRNAKLMLEIHDSFTADVPKIELKEFIAVAKRIMTEELPKAWPWIIVPLNVEVSIADSNWFNKEAIE